MFNYLYPILNGLCGSLAGYAGTKIVKLRIGKIAFSADPHFVDFYYVENIVAFILMLNFNKFMFQFLFKSYETNGSSVTTLVSFVANNALNVNN